MDFVDNDKIAFVNTYEHATLVIKSLRSKSHSQQCYHRSACRDDQILSGINEFTSLINIATTETVQKASIVNMIDEFEPPRLGKSFNSANSHSTPSLIEDNIDAVSSDDETGSSPKKNKKHNKKLSNASPSKSPPSHDMRVSHTNATTDVDSDEEFLRGLGSDEEDDNSELFAGFVAPSGIHRSAPVGNVHSMYGDENCHHGDDDDDDSFSFMNDYVNDDAQTHSSNMSKATRGKQSSNNGGSQKSVSGSSAVSTVRQKLQNSISISKGNGNGSSSQSVNTAYTANTTNTTSSASAGQHNQHKVIIKPGQRIVVKPVGRNNKSK